MRWIAGPALLLALGAAATAADLPAPIVGKHHYLHGYPARNADGTVNVVVECPAGTIVKWEVSDDGAMRVQPDRLGIGWQGQSAVRFLAYPGSYGMVPRTHMPRSAGGEGEPLDVLVLGGAIPRGTVARVRLIGALAMLDGDEQDDKLIAVVEDSPLGDIRDVAELDARYPGVTDIVETWFTHSKGVGSTTSDGFVGAAAAERLVDAAVHFYTEEYPANSSPRDEP